ncbi:MAG: hypothetical protein AAGC72_01135 [Planctomycetota bacterium]
MPGLVRIDTSTFFDRDKVLDKLDRDERRLLSRAGAFVRRRARSSIRKRKGISKSGKPPASHTGQYKKSILFGYEKSSRSVVIGPSASFGGSEVPELLEFGGSAKRGGRTVNYDARPHMGPALEAETPNFPELFTNSVTA